MREWPGRLWRATWKIALFGLLWAAFFAPAPFVLGLDVSGSSAPLAPWTRLQLESWGAVAVLIAAWLMTTRVDGRSLRSLGFGPAHAARDLLVGLALGAGMIGFALLVLWLSGRLDLAFVGSFSWSRLALMSGVVLVNSVTQEVLVRGYLQQTIEAGFGVWIALMASAAAFTALHAGAIGEGGLLPGLNLFAAGILLGLAYATTRNLWLPIALHFSWNVLQGPVLGIAVSGQALDSGWRVLRLEGPRLLTGGAFGLEGGLVGTLVVGLAITVLMISQPHLEPETPR